MHRAGLSSYIKRQKRCVVMLFGIGIEIEILLIGSTPQRTSLPRSFNLMEISSSKFLCTNRPRNSEQPGVGVVLAVML
jgi:hypothetical protein